MKAALHPQEDRRLAALRSYGILDTPRESDFDDMVRVASEVCEAPISVINLIDSGRQWFKAEIGLGVRETPIDSSLCAHAILRPGLTIVPDTTQDDRFRRNPLVVGEPGLRFYAGALLETIDGLPLGTFCILDYKPRSLNGTQKSLLKVMAKQVMKTLELQKVVRETIYLAEDLRVSETRLRLAQEAGKIGSFEIHIPTDRMTVTERFCRVYGLPVATNIEPASVERLVVEEDRELGSTTESRRSVSGPLHTEYRIHRADDGRLAWISRRGQIEFDPAGKPLRMLGTVHDITDRKLAEENLKLANVELGHRLKNSMTLVQAIAFQTLRGVSDKTALAAFNQRLAALSRAQDVLVGQGWLAADMGDVIRGALPAHGKQEQFRIDGPEVNVEAKAALSLAMLFHELATNAVKYGALSVDSGRVAVEWELKGDYLALTWAETGGPEVRPPMSSGLGTKLVDMGILGTRDVSKTYHPAGFTATFRAPVALIRMGT